MARRKQKSKKRTSSDFRIVGIGASAGGLDGLLKLVGNLKPDLGAGVFVVLHVRSPSFLPQILQRISSLPVAHANDGDAVEPGRVLIAPPDQHLVFSNNHVVLSRGPKQNGSRPAIDPLFTSAARLFGKRMIGVVLSGAMDDGSAGLATIKKAGGVTIVQDPADANSPEMPRNAIAATKVDFILPAREIGAKLNMLVESARNGGKSARTKKMSQPQRTIEKSESDPNVFPNGKISTLTCPECGGTLWELHKGNVLRFGCHVGHNYSAKSLLDTQGNQVEAAMWMALRTLKERSNVYAKLKADARRRHWRHSEKRYADQAKEYEDRAELLRHVLLAWPPDRVDTDETARPRKISK